jgi:hypothetical protein
MLPLRIAAAAYISGSRGLEGAVGAADACGQAVKAELDRGKRDAAFSSRSNAEARLVEWPQVGRRAPPGCRGNLVARGVERGAQAKQFGERHNLVGGVRPPTDDVCSRSRSTPPSRISRTAS